MGLDLIKKKTLATDGAAEEMCEECCKEETKKSCDPQIGGAATTLEGEGGGRGGRGGGEEEGKGVCVCVIKLVVCAMTV